jgi:hypothetical protein
MLNRHSAGYGVTYVNGRRVPAHRYMYEKAGHTIPDGMVLDHLCRNRACVNPDHLEPVSIGENGRRGAQAKLTLEDARRIREMRVTLSTKEIADMYGVLPCTISRIFNGKRWPE